MKSLHIEDGKHNLVISFNEHYYNGEYYPSTGLFSECNLKSLYIGRNILGDTSKNTVKPPFKGCPITQLTIGDSVTNIGESAFEDCTSLTNLKIGNSIVYIGEDAFLGCIALNEIHISDLSAWCKIKFD